MRFKPHSHRVAIAVAIATLLSAGVALAASPKPGKQYSGTTSAQKVNGYSAPLSFKVSKSGKQLQGFQYADEGCFPTMTQPSGNPFTSAGSVHSLGTIGVAGGKFSVKNVKTTLSLKIPGGTLKTVTTSAVKGKFTSAIKATGTITFSQTQTAPGLNHSCGPTTRTFTATAH